MATPRLASFLLCACGARAAKDEQSFNCTGGNSSEWPAKKRLWCFENWEEQTTSMPYNCSDGFDDWEDAWPNKKKKWCCDHVERGCPIVLHEAPAQHDCDDGYFTWELAWTSSKKKWCCQKTGRGCSEGGEPADGDERDAKEVSSFHCNSTASKWRTWSVGKKAWCCSKANVGCQEDEQSSKPFDCGAGFNNWAAGWSEEKKEWCCKHEQKACQASHPYDCEAGFNNWKMGWSQEKKRWCCEFKDVGCAKATASATERHSTTTRKTRPPYDCTEDADRWQQAWTVAKEAWCCLHAAIGCPNTTTTSTQTRTVTRTGTTTSTTTTRTTRTSSTTSGPGCDATCKYQGVVATCHFRIVFAAAHGDWGGLDSCREARSSILQRCPSCGGCQLSDLDCASGNATLGVGAGGASASVSTTSARPANNATATTSLGATNKATATASLGTTSTSASVPKSTHQHRTTSMSPSSTAAGEARPHGGSSSSSPSTTSALRFDCDAGYAHRELGWSLLKKRWCCEHRNVTCNQNVKEETDDASVKSTPFNCTSGLVSWESAWAELKKSWCCKNEGLGCPVTTTSWAYNCSAGLAGWEIGWAGSKKTWCCQHEGVGCEKNPIPLSDLEQKQQLQPGQGEPPIDQASATSLTMPWHRRRVPAYVVPMLCAGAFGFAAALAGLAARVVRTRTDASYVELRVPTGSAWRTSARSATKADSDSDSSGSDADAGSGPRMAGWQLRMPRRTAASHALLPLWDSTSPSYTTIDGEGLL